MLIQIKLTGPWPSAWPEMEEAQSAIPDLKAGSSHHLQSSVTGRDASPVGSGLIEPQGTQLVQFNKASYADTVRRILHQKRD